MIYPNFKTSIIRPGILIVLFSLCACSSNIPKSIEKSPVPDIRYSTIKKNPSAYSGKSVRWGGKIISIQNQAQSSQIEILLRKLDVFGEPVSDHEPPGRFFALIDEFIDPEQYDERLITVFGTISSTATQKIGAHDYQYPIIQVSEYHIWPDYQALYRRRQFYYPDLFYPGYFHPGFIRFPNRYPLYYHPYYRNRLRFGSGFFLHHW